MTKGILGRKVGMTQVFGEDGVAHTVTVLEVGPCSVLQIRTPDRDGYSAVQMGFLDKPRKVSSRAESGHVSAKLSSKRSRSRASAGVEVLAKAECEPKRFVREFRGDVAGAEVGQEVTVAAFDGVAAVDVIGASKGRGYAGVMKRHNFKGQRATHGVKKVHRHAGGTGTGGTYPGRTVKGSRMAGRYGGERVTVRNLKVVGIDAENNLLLVKGAVPGPNGGMLMVRETNKVG